MRQNNTKESNEVIDDESLPVPVLKEKPSKFALLAHRLIKKPVILNVGGHRSGQPSRVTQFYLLFGGQARGEVGHSQQLSHKQTRQNKEPEPEIFPLCIRMAATELLMRNNEFSGSPVCIRQCISHEGLLLLCDSYTLEPREFYFNRLYLSPLTWRLISHLKISSKLRCCAGTLQDWKAPPRSRGESED